MLRVRLRRRARLLPQYRRNYCVLDGRPKAAAPRMWIPRYLYRRWKLKRPPWPVGVELFYGFPDESDAALEALRAEIKAYLPSTGLLTRVEL